ncbi:hypothetical protein ACU4GD_17150 [Cupriavidus basilensis]
MVPMEGKAVLAYWDHQARPADRRDSATQVPHMIRTVLSRLPEAWSRRRSA